VIALPVLVCTWHGVGLFVCPVMPMLCRVGCCSRGCMSMGSWLPPGQAAGLSGVLAAPPCVHAYSSAWRLFSCEGADSPTPCARRRCGGLGRPWQVCKDVPTASHADSAVPPLSAYAHPTCHVVGQCGLRPLLWVCRARLLLLKGLQTSCVDQFSGFVWHVHICPKKGASYTQAQ